MRCLHCGYDNDTDAVFCENCGSPIENHGQDSSFFCPECGTKNDADALFCEGCGVRFSHGTMEKALPEKKKKNPIVPVILAVVFIGVCVCAAAGAFFLHKRGESKRSDIAQKVAEAERKEAEAKDKKIQETRETTETEENEEEEKEKEAEAKKEEQTQKEPEAAVQNEASPSPVQEPVQAPVITMQNISAVYATSELAEANVVHSASRIMDGDKNTAWVEGVDGQGYGQAVRFDFNNVYLVSGIRIRSGYHKNDDIYYKNSRPKEICIGYSDGTSEIFKLDDAGLNEQILTFSHPVETNMVNLSIESVYPGGKYEDTCISEVTFF